VLSKSLNINKCDPSILFRTTEPLLGWPGLIDEYIMGHKLLAEKSHPVVEVDHWPTRIGKHYNASCIYDEKQVLKNIFTKDDVHLTRPKAKSNHGWYAANGTYKRRRRALLGHLQISNRILRKLTINFAVWLNKTVLEHANGLVEDADSDFWRQTGLLLYPFAN